MQKLNLNPWATASPRFIVPDNMLLDAIERAKRDVSVIKDKEWSLFQRGMMASPKSPIGSAYGFMRPKQQSIEISNRQVRIIPNHFTAMHKLHLIISFASGLTFLHSTYVSSLGFIQ